VLVLECIIHQRDDELHLPIRRMIGPYPSFDDAMTAVDK
jgi:hypothetical protein